MTPGYTPHCKKPASPKMMRLYENEPKTTLSVSCEVRNSQMSQEPPNGQVSYNLVRDGRTCSGTRLPDFSPSTTY